MFLKRQNFASLIVIFGVYPLANTIQAKKRARQAEVRRERNISQKSTIRTAIKKVLKSTQSNDKATASTAYQSVVTLVDRAVNKKLIHANHAARLKSRLNMRLKKLS